MKLNKKLRVSQILVFLTIFIIFIILLPNIIFIATRNQEKETLMNFNEQITMRVDKSFGELERFIKFVSDDEKLNRLLDVYLEQPTRENEAMIQLYLSELNIIDKVPSHKVLGIYVDINNDNYSRGISTVGMSSSLVDHINSEVLPNFYEEEKKELFIEPFSFIKGESSSLFGTGFNKGYGLTSYYNKHGIEGSITIISPFDDIVYIIEDVSDYSNDYLFLYDENTPVISSSSNLEFDIYKLLSNFIYGDSFFEGYYLATDSVITIRMSQYGDWTLISRLNKNDIINNNKSTILMTGVLMVIFGMIVIAINVLIVQRFVKPLGDVSVQMAEIASGNLDARVTITSKDEIGEIGEVFNVMTEELNVNIRKLIEKEKTAEKMRYSILISQIDPHFIYNTMNTITYLAQKERNEDVIKVNNAMIDILRDRLRIEITDIYDTVKQEINVVKKYLTIQKYRYEGTFKTKFEISEETHKYLIVKNVLQPLVENALIHGILTYKDENGEILGGCITMKVVQEEAHLAITIEDNGSGMPQEIIENIENQSKTPNRGKHIGIRNIIERIKYIYGESYEFKIKSVIGEGTRVVLRLPIIEEREGGGFST